MGNSIYSAAFFLVLAGAAVQGYLIGSINMAILVSRAKYGKDVRTLGSGNAGMTNVLRNFDRSGAALTMAGDTLKGIATVFIGKGLILLFLPGVDALYGGYIAAIATIIGHSYPIYFGFKGGKGVATSLGVILALTPLVALALLLIFVIIVLCSRIVSLGSVIAIMLYAPANYLWRIIYAPRVMVFSTVCCCIISLCVVFLHRENIKRIFTGKEYKFGQKKV